MYQYLEKVDFGLNNLRSLSSYKKRFDHNGGVC